MKTYTSLAVLALIVACGPAPELKRRPLTFITDETLMAPIDKAYNQLLHDKYQDHITLNCAFKIDDREGFNIGLANASTFSWDLIGGKIPETMKFGMMNHRQFQVRVDVTAFRILDKLKPNYVDAEGVEYEMRSTPEVELTLNWADSFKQGKAGKGKRVVKIYENVPEIVINDLFDKKLPQELRCSLKTLIAPDFIEQWRIIPKAVDKPAVEIAPAPTAEEAAPVTNDQPSQESANPSGQENVGSSQEGPATGTH